MRSWMVGQYYFDVVVHSQIHVKVDVIESCERVRECMAEKLSILLSGKYILVGIQVGFIHGLEVHQMVADLIAWITEHYCDLPAAHGQAFENVGESVPRKGKIHH